MFGYEYLDLAFKYAHVPVKQAVISPSALSLMYPAEHLLGYSREEFIRDLLAEHEKEIRGCLAKGAYKVQIDFTEGRLAVKLDSSGSLLNGFIELNNLALSRFSEEERKQIGVHTCPGSDRDSTHSAQVDYAELLPSLFELKVGNFYIALADEPDRTRVLKIIQRYLRPEHRIFIGVVSPIDPPVKALSRNFYRTSLTASARRTLRLHVAMAALDLVFRLSGNWSNFMADRLASKAMERDLDRLSSSHCRLLLCMATQNRGPNVVTRVCRPWA